jgi:hypothetical protein
MIKTFSLLVVIAGMIVLALPHVVHAATDPYLTIDGKNTIPLKAKPTPSPSPSPVAKKQGSGPHKVSMPTATPTTR